MNNNNFYTKLNFIGFQVESPQNHKPDYSSDQFLSEYDLETILLQACYEVDQDSRLLSLLFSWGQIHGEYIIANKFLKYYEVFIKTRGECPWVSAFCAFMVSLKRQKFAKGIKKYNEKVWVGNRPQEEGIKMKGSIDYLEPLNIFIPNGNVRLRNQDALSPEELLKINQQYKSRYLFGANFRADIIYAVQMGFTNPYRISKTLQISYENVRDTYNDYIKLKDLQLL